MTVHIYALRDPETNAVRYVGQCKDPERRMIQHRASKKSAAYAWLKSLETRALKAKVEVLASCDLKDATAWEGFFYQRFQRDGHPLLNKQVEIRRLSNGATPESQLPPAPTPEILKKMHETGTPPTLTANARSFTWGRRPHGSRCAEPDCGRPEPLFGFKDSEGSFFYCAYCAADLGLDPESSSPRNTNPRRPGRRIP